MSCFKWDFLDLVDVGAALPLLFLFLTLWFLSDSKVSFSFLSWQTKFILDSLKTLTVASTTLAVSSVAVRLAYQQDMYPVSSVVGLASAHKQYHVLSFLDLTLAS